HFEFTSWRFFREEEFAGHLNQKHFLLAYVLSRNSESHKPAYQGDIVIFPVRKFVEIVRQGIPSKGQREVYLSRLKGDEERWVLRKATHFAKITDEACLDVTEYRRNFAVLSP